MLESAPPGIGIKAKRTYKSSLVKGESAPPGIGIKAKRASTEGCGCSQSAPPGIGIKAKPTGRDVGSGRSLRPPESESRQSEDGQIMRKLAVCAPRNRNQGKAHLRGLPGRRQSAPPGIGIKAKQLIGG